MKRTTQLGALCLAGGLALTTAALAQDDTAQSQQTTTTKQTTQVTDDGVARTTTTTVTGKVVRYEPGKTIVVLGPDNKQMSYTLANDINAPSDVAIGKQVSLSTEPGENGAVMVHKITTQSVTSDGKLKTETQTRTIDPNGNSTTMNSTSVTGTVSAFEPGKSVTIQLPDQKSVVYTIDNSSVIPSDVAVGKTYTIQTTRTSANGPLVVRKITTTTTTTKKTTAQ
ncbi:MAG TPA: hypothetical protein VGK26_06620 [Thermoanaerobaculia bacterium]